MRRLRRIVLRLLLAVVILYITFAGFMWWAMRQSPEKFGRIMSKMPGTVVFMLFPFETTWVHARAGALNVGDHAPDFTLLKVDKSETIQLSKLNNQRPVVLVFGSYT